MHTIPLQFGLPGGPELLIILFIAILLFGANKIPELARSSGEAIGEFQKGREEIEQELEEMQQSASAPSRGTETHAEAKVSTGTAGEETEQTGQVGAEDAETVQQAEPEA